MRPLPLRAVLAHGLLRLLICSLCGDRVAVVDETFERAQALKQLIKKDSELACESVSRVAVHSLAFLLCSARFELVLSERKAGSSSGGSSGGSGASGASAGAASAFAAPSFSGAPADTFAVSFWYLPEAIRYGVKRGDRKPGDPAFKVNLIKVPHDFCGMQLQPLHQVFVLPCLLQLIPAIYSKLVADGNMAVNLVSSPRPCATLTHPSTCLLLAWQVVPPEHSLPPHFRVVTRYVI